MTDKCKLNKDGICKSPLTNDEMRCADIAVENCYYKQLQRKTAEIERSVKKAIKILMEGRTFYDGYFDRPFEKMSRIDQATYILLKGVKEWK